MYGKSIERALKYTHFEMKKKLIGTLTTFRIIRPDTVAMEISSVSCIQLGGKMRTYEPKRPTYPFFLFQQVFP